MPRKGKLGTPQGVAEWQTLETVGDVRRLLRWLVLSVCDQSMDTKTAATLGQLACYLQRSIEGGEVEARLDELEKQMEERNGTLSAGTPTAH